jgi:GR25 family glycosyltransferase involved in LPS biosynthesis
MVVDRNLDSAIIFEDDVRLVDNFKDTLQTYLQRLETEGNSYDVLLLGAIGRVHPDGKESFGSRLFSNYIGGKRPRQVLSNYLFKPRRPAGTHAYMVSNAGARRLLGLCPKATFHVDLDVSPVRRGFFSLASLPP